MRQTSVKFNYGGVQGSSYTQPLRTTTTNVVTQPPPTYSVSQQPIKVHQTSIPNTVTAQNQVFIF